MILREQTPPDCPPLFRGSSDRLGGAQVCQPLQRGKGITTSAESELLVRHRKNLGKHTLPVTLQGNAVKGEGKGERIFEIQF